VRSDVPLNPEPAMRNNELREAIADAFTQCGGGGGGTGKRRRATSYWSADDIATLVRLAQAQATTRQIAIELGRTAQSIRLKASRMGLPLTAHEVRRSARRHAKRQGTAAVADAKSLRRRPRIAITVDFDLSSLTRHERRQLAERLRAMDEEEGGAEHTSPPSIEEGASVTPTSGRRLRIPKPYNPSTATAARNRAASADRAANRGALGWTRQGPVSETEQERMEDRWELKRAMREKRRLERKAPKRVSLEDAARELASGLAGGAASELDPIDRMEMERLLQDPAMARRLLELELAMDAEEEEQPYREPREDEYARYRRYLRGE